MLRRNSSIKADIEKIKKLRSLQQQATDKLNKITQDAALKSPKKKKTKPALKRKPAVKNTTGTTAKKDTLWKKVFRKKTGTEKITRAPKLKSKSPGKNKHPHSTVANEGFIFRHFGRR
jgi:hypothetical protein